MPDVNQILNERFASAFEKALGSEHANADPILRPSGNPKFGDYQSNCAMGLAKKVGQKPRDLAQQVVDAIELDDVCSKLEIAGPGFINLHLRESFLNDQMNALAADDRLGVDAADPQTVVIDYSSPNVAKEMHVGHLRSTIIGDAIARVLSFLGHNVIRQNHLGDWGTQFGMLIEYLNDSGWDQSVDHSISDLDQLYRDARARFNSEDEFAERSRKRVVALQGGDVETIRLWQMLIEESQRHFGEVYLKLGVLLVDEDVCGESFYNDMLPAVVDDLDAAGQLKTSDGAAVVYPEGFFDQDKNPLGMIVRKSDGGYLYATTDLAAARHRINNLGAGRVVYVTDARQGQHHFPQLFQALRQVGWAPDAVALDHVPFGMVCGKDGKPFATREGKTVKLTELIDEAVERAGTIIEQKNPELPESDRADIANAIGVGAMKYADLSSDRIKNYVFDWERMLSFDGNTAPYLQNAYVRTRGIFRRGEFDPNEVRSKPIMIDEPAEKMLALKLMQYADAVRLVGETLEPHKLCNYLYELASLFHSFFENCPVLKAGSDELRDSRLALCELVGRTLRHGLGLLGIKAVGRM